METILQYLKRRLRDVGPGQWEIIAEQAGVAKTLPRKVAYGDRENPGVQTVQPLLDYFKRIDGAEAKRSPRKQKVATDRFASMDANT